MACGQSNNGGPAQAPAPLPPGLITPNGTGTGTCQAGQIYNQQYGYLSPGNCQPGYGYVPAQNTCVQGQAMDFQTCYGQQASSRWAAGLSISNRTSLEALLKYSGVCDPYWIGWNFGTWSCSNYSSQGFIIIEALNATAGEVNITIGAGASTPYSNNYYNGGGQYLTLSMRGLIHPINNSTGMEIVGSNYAAQNLGFRGTVDTGTLKDQTYTIKLFFQDVQFAQTTVQRW